MQFKGIEGGGGGAVGGDKRPRVMSIDLRLTFA